MPRRPDGPTTAARVADHLTRTILAGRRRPGEHLVAEEVAAELGISRFPVREALRSLEGGGLVVARPRRGAFVAAVDDPVTLREIVETRARLEPWAAERAALAHDGADLDALTTALAAGSRALAVGSRAEVGLAHHRYLRALAGAAHHPTLDATLAPLQHRTMLAFAILRLRVEPDGWSSHLAVRDAVAAGDAGRARDLVAEHLAEVVAALREPDALVAAALGGSGPRPQRTENP